MVRSLWTGATGMIAQQLNVDIISNNLANVNTNSSITSVFTQGSLLESSGPANFAIDGNGFFGIRGDDGNTYYTRNGHFVFAVGNNGMTLTTSDGLPVLNSSGEPIVLDSDAVVSKVTISKDGTLYYPDDKGNPQSLGITIGSLYSVTAASGAAMNEASNPNLTKSSLKQGYLEGSNVQIADEMVNLIVAQRAYEMNSKVITTSDEMLQQANQLKR